MKRFFSILAIIAFLVATVIHAGPPVVQGINLSNMGAISASSITDTGLTASKPVFTDGSKVLTSTGTLGVDQGGTGVATLAIGGILLGNTAAAVNVLAPGATTDILVGGGAGTNPVWTAATGTGAPVRATSPSLVTPVLGTPTSGDLVNCTFSVGNVVNFTKSQVLDAFYRIITPANARLVLFFDQTGAVSTITDRSTIGGTTAHVTTLRDSGGNAINASTLSPAVQGLAPNLNFNGSNNWDTPDAADLSFGNGAADSPFSIISLVKFNSALTNQTILAKKNVATASIEYLLTVYSDGRVYINCVDQSAGTAQIGRSAPAGTVTVSAYHTVISTKSSGITAASMKIYVDGVPVDTANDNAGVYVAMEDLTALVGAYQIETGPTKSNIGDHKAAFISIVAEELTALQVRQLDTVLRGWVGTSFN